MILELLRIVHKESSLFLDKDTEKADFVIFNDLYNILDRDDTFVVKASLIKITQKVLLEIRYRILRNSNNDFEAIQNLLQKLTSASNVVEFNSIFKDELVFTVNILNGLNNIGQKDWIEGIKSLNAAISNCPRSVEGKHSSCLSTVLILLAEAYSALGQGVDALRSAKLAVALVLEPKQSTSINLNFKPLLEEKPSLLAAYYTLACVLEHSVNGGKQLAVEWYDRVIRIAKKMLSEKTLQDVSLQKEEDIDLDDDSEKQMFDDSNNSAYVYDQITELLRIAVASKSALTQQLLQIEVVSSASHLIIEKNVIQTEQNIRIEIENEIEEGVGEGVAIDRGNSFGSNTDHLYDIKRNSNDRIERPETVDSNVREDNGIENDQYSPPIEHISKNKGGWNVSDSTLTSQLHQQQLSVSLILSPSNTLNNTHPYQKQTPLLKTRPQSALPRLLSNPSTPMRLKSRQQSTQSFTQPSLFKLNKQQSKVFAGHRNINYNNDNHDVGYSGMEIDDDDLHGLYIEQQQNSYNPHTTPYIESFSHKQNDNVNNQWAQNYPFYKHSNYSDSTPSLFHRTPSNHPQDHQYQQYQENEQHEEDEQDHSQKFLNNNSHRECDHDKNIPLLLNTELDGITPLYPSSSGISNSKVFVYYNTNLNHSLPKSLVRNQSDMSYLPTACLTINKRKKSKKRIVEDKKGRVEKLRREMFSLRVHAAVTIQRICRGYLDRISFKFIKKQKSFNMKRKKRNVAVIMMQKIFRGFYSRNNFYYHLFDLSSLYQSKNYSQIISIIETKESSFNKTEKARNINGSNMLTLTELLRKEREMALKNNFKNFHVVLEQGRLLLEDAKRMRLREEARIVHDSQREEEQIRLQEELMTVRANMLRYKTELITAKASLPLISQIAMSQTEQLLSPSGVLENSVPLLLINKEGEVLSLDVTTAVVTEGATEIDETPLIIPIISSSHSCKDILVDRESKTEKEGLCSTVVVFDNKTLEEKVVSYNKTEVEMETFAPDNIDNTAVKSELLSLKTNQLLQSINSGENNGNKSIFSNNNSTEIANEEIRKLITLGTRVDAQYLAVRLKKKSIWLEGSIIRVGMDGTYDILYDNGNSEVGVHLEHIRIKKLQEMFIITNTAVGGIEEDVKKTSPKRILFFRIRPIWGVGEGLRSVRRESRGRSSPGRGTAVSTRKNNSIDMERYVRETFSKIDQQDKEVDIFKHQALIRLQALIRGYLDRCRHRGLMLHINRGKILRKREEIVRERENRLWNHFENLIISEKNELSSKENESNQEIQDQSVVGVYQIPQSDMNASEAQSVTPRILVPLKLMRVTSSMLKVSKNLLSKHSSQQQQQQEQQEYQIPALALLPVEKILPDSLHLTDPTFHTAHIPLSIETSTPKTPMTPPCFLDTPFMSFNSNIQGNKSSTPFSDKEMNGISDKENVQLLVQGADGVMTYRATPQQIEPDSGFYMRVDNDGEKGNEENCFVKSNSLLSVLSVSKKNSRNKIEVGEQESPSGDFLSHEKEGNEDKDGNKETKKMKPSHFSSFFFHKISIKSFSHSKRQSKSSK